MCGMFLAVLEGLRVFQRTGVCCPEPYQGERDIYQVRSDQGYGGGVPPFSRAGFDHPHE